MNSAEQTVTWLITLGVLESPKKSISDPEGFLQSSLKDGVVLCRLLERLSPGSMDKIYHEPKNDGECLSNIKEFLKGCLSFRIEPFEASDLLLGLNFSKVLSTLVALNKVTADIGVGSDSVCARYSSAHRIKSFESLSSQASLGRSSKLIQNQFRSLDMSENSGQQVLVKARFNFQQTNEDELTFNKGDIINVTRQEEGGWWEGTLNGKTGWFPSNYVREVKGSDKQVSPKSGTLKSPPKGFDTSTISKTYYNLVLQNILETETEYSKDLQSLLTNYLRPLQSTDKLSCSDVALILGNLEEICTFQQMLVQSLEESTKLPESQQRVGAFFLNLMPQMKALYVAYCSNHPSAVNVLTQHSEYLGEFMEGHGAVNPGTLTLTTGLSKPFMRLDKYPTLLKELERHMEEGHPDRTDIQKAMVAFKNLSSHCQEVRKRKELELQILTETIRLWEGDDIKTLGSVLYMSQVLVQAGSEEKSERYLMLFPHVLLLLSASPRMSGFIFQGKLPLAGMIVSKLEDCEAYKNAFELNGTLFDRLLVVCLNQQDLQDWIEHLTRQIKHNAATAPSHKPLTVPCHTLPSHPLTPSRHAEGRAMTVAPTYHTLPHPSSHGSTHSTMMWGPLEPPNTPKPWSLSCLRPAPPLRPSAALCYKEDLSKSPKSVKKLLPKRKPERKQSEEEFSLRKSTAALEEDAQILKVIEAYCTSAKTRQTLNSTWQGTDLMHNHVLADVDRSCVDSPGRRSSVSRPELSSDLSEDSDYDSIWTTHSYRMGSVPRPQKNPGLHVIIPAEDKVLIGDPSRNGQSRLEEKSLVDIVYALRDEVQELKQDTKKMKRSLEEEQKARKDIEKVVRRVLKSMNDPTWDETNL
ncbi:rho guanine nucleotide exchange factor 7a isoform X3 [Periophthalmus magnuspinnatus]|uniref:rho guanine nucleotide exchange factor 7a isoform X3 n=1 Tax=Periophthalmus magnuspinnatus TaxID=409849 RepID=UPI00145B17CB|nr:rho guanine nucleotide exchange factor 7a isoform X3 [Periophthalmus magnuspinnatus]